MSPSTKVDQARSLIEDRLKELEDEKARLERTLSEMTDRKSVV